MLLHPRIPTHTTFNVVLPLRQAHEDRVIYPLPFGYVLKSKPRLREQERLAMNLARAMGVPAPKFISYGEPPACSDDF